jgi:membrane associated rhomboid family serine protease
MSGSFKDHEHVKFRHAVFMVISFNLLLWFVKALEFAGDMSFAHFGILPRTLRGSIGIIAGPLIHGDFIHLFSNTLPLLILGILLFYFYHKIAIEIFLWIYLATGFWIWLLARNAYHIGASGIVYGIASFLFFSGIFRRNNQLMAISGVIIILYGGMLYGIFPDYVETNVSWEAHLMGGIVGIILAFWFRKSKIDIESQGMDSTDEENEVTNQEYFKAPTTTEDIEANYTYKPKDRKT